MFTRREVIIHYMLCSEINQKKICEILNISKNTLETHIKKMKNKTLSCNRINLLLAYEHATLHYKDPPTLTRREEQIIRYILLGFTEVSIANKLNISPRTVREHKKNMIRRIEHSTD